MSNVAKLSDRYDTFLMPRKAIENIRDLKALGLLAKMVACYGYNPVNESNIIASMKVSRAAYSRSLQSLSDCGYIDITTNREQGGRFAGRTVRARYIPFTSTGGSS